ncbi:hypothetical protein ACFWOY_11935 [Streptomyces sp. NPDC058423]|uniref:hypothetical protein n=1 Tax=unclassified Streptomyces TaxID=2593676 RepID=UPI003660B696
MLPPVEEQPDETGEHMGRENAVEDAQHHAALLPPLRVLFLERLLLGQATMSVGLLPLAVGLFVISRLDVGSRHPPFLAGLIVAGIGIGLSGSG